MIVIGKGMMANAFSAACDGPKDLLVFCSGVSDSNTSLDSEFEREKSLLMDSLNRSPEHKIIYFSSCAVGIVDSPYYRHKHSMEQVVLSNAQRYLIVRLPQVVGVVKNATLVSFITESIKNRTPISVFEGARRNLLDVDDVLRLTLYLAGLGNMAINVTNANMVPIEEIIRMISRILSIEPILQTKLSVAKVPDYEGERLKQLIGHDDPIYAEGYNQAILSKYVPLLVSLTEKFRQEC